MEYQKHCTQVNADGLAVNTMYYMRYPMDNVKCLNPWDPQSKRQYQIDGVYATLNAGQAIGGQAHGICYCIEGNTVDRKSGKNGRGWCEDVSPTLNTQDRHAVCYAIQGNVTRGSKQRGEGFYKDVSPTIVAGDRHAVCFQFSGDRDNPSVSVSDTAYCIPANPMSDRGQAVCYRKTAHLRNTSEGQGYEETSIADTEHI